MTQAISVPTDAYFLIANHLPDEDIVPLSRVSRAAFKILIIPVIRDRVAHYKQDRYYYILSEVVELTARIYKSEVDVSRIRSDCDLKKYEIVMNTTATILDLKQAWELMQFFSQDENTGIIPLIEGDLSKIKEMTIDAFNDLDNAKKEYDLLVRSDHKSGDFITKEQHLKVKLEVMQNRLNLLRGPTGFDGLIDQAYRGRQGAQSIFEFNALVKELEALAVFDTNGCIVGGKIHLTTKKLEELQREYGSMSVVRAHKDLEEMQNRLNLLRGPTGFDGLIDQAYKKMQETTGFDGLIDRQAYRGRQGTQSIFEFNALVKELEALAVFDTNGCIIGGKIHLATKKLEELQREYGEYENLPVRRNIDKLSLAQDDQIQAFAHVANIPFSIAFSLIAIYTRKASVIEEVKVFVRENKKLRENEAGLTSMNDERRRIALHNDKGELIGGRLQKFYQ